jgi:hypothetical protein
MIPFMSIAIALTAIAVPSAPGFPLRSTPNAFSRQTTAVNPGSAPANEPIRSVAEIAALMKAQGSVGRDVVLRDARVIRAAGPRSFWIDGGEGRRVFVVVDAPTLEAAAGCAFGAGDQVSVEGVLKAVPGRHGQKIEDWGRLDEDDAKALEKHAVYIYAKHVAVAGKPR